jgi:hypothetical protein
VPPGVPQLHPSCSDLVDEEGSFRPGDPTEVFMVRSGPCGEGRGSDEVMPSV